MTHIIDDHVGGALTLLTTLRIATATEELVQTAIERVFTQAGLEFEREVRLAPRDRIDFMVGSCGIEVKIKGSTADVQAQLQRYAQSTRVTELVLITTRVQHGSKIDSVAVGKPLRVYTLWGAIL